MLVVVVVVAVMVVMSGMICMICMVVLWWCLFLTLQRMSPDDGPEAVFVGLVPQHVAVAISVNITAGERIINRFCHN